MPIQAYDDKKFIEIINKLLAEIEVDGQEQEAVEFDLKDKTPAEIREAYEAGKLKRYFNWGRE